MLIFTLLACGGPPKAPLANDPAYTIDHREWHLIGNALTDGHETLEVAVDAPADAGELKVWVGNEPHTLDADGTASIDISDLPPGDVPLVWADGGTAFALTRIVRSHPMYVLVSVDWDSADTPDFVLDWQFTLHDEHPELVITHFVGPYTWTDPELTDERKDELTADLYAYEADHGDEIGLHIHPYCNFVETTEVTCITDTSFAGEEGDETGYTVPNWVYSEEEFTTLLLAADDIFMDQGFDKPTSYRAGGWSMDLHVLTALENAGYVADTSANNWARLEEWEGQGTLYSWNQQQWASIDETSQPYYPSSSDILAPGDDFIGVLEVPDNGILADYVDEAEMIEMFEANFDGDPLVEPLQYSIGWHDSASPTYQNRIDRTLDYLDENLAVTGDGPVVFENLSDMVLVWPNP